MNDSSNSVANKCLLTSTGTVQEKDLSIVIVDRLQDYIIYTSLCIIKLSSVDCDSGSKLFPVLVELLINKPVSLCYNTSISYDLWHAWNI